MEKRLLEHFKQTLIIKKKSCWLKLLICTLNYHKRFLSSLFFLWFFCLFWDMWDDEDDDGHSVMGSVCAINIRKKGASFGYIWREIRVGRGFWYSETLYEVLSTAQWAQNPFFVQKEPFFVKKRCFTPNSFNFYPKKHQIEFLVKLRPKTWVPLLHPPIMHLTSLSLVADTAPRWFILNYYWNNVQTHELHALLIIVVIIICSYV